MERLIEHTSTELSSVQIVQQLPLTSRVREFAYRAIDFGLIGNNNLEDTYFWEREFKKDMTAAHEEGHAMVAEAEGGVVIKRTIIPEGRALGYCVTTFLNMPLREWLFKRVVVAFGGRVAEEKMGLADHRGCGSDDAHAQMYAEILSTYIYQGRVSASMIMSEAMSRARAIVSSKELLWSRGLKLHALGTIT